MQLGQPLASDRLRLRTLTAADADERYRGWLHDPEVNRFLESRFVEHSLDTLRDYIETCNSGGTDLLLGICLANGRHIGNIKLGPVDWHHRNAGVGLLIGERDCWGKGYATEAIERVTTYAFDELDLAKLDAGCYASNVGSARAFVKAGWSEEGRSRDQWLLAGSREDGLRFGISRAEWATDRT